MSRAAPLDRDAVAAALRPFGSSRALPGAAYTSAAVLDWERRHLFAGGWTCSEHIFGTTTGYSEPPRPDSDPVRCSRKG